MNQRETAPCFVCKTECECSESSNVNNLCTTYSKTLLCEYIEKLVKEKVVCFGWVCPGCFKLFNELDLAEKKVIDFTAKLCSYLNCSLKVTCDAYSQTEGHAEDHWGQEVFDNSNLQDKQKTCGDSARLKDEKHECRVCFKKFFTKRGLAMHIKRLHVTVSKSDALTNDILSAQIEDNDSQQFRRNNNNEVKEETRESDLQDMKCSTNDSLNDVAKDNCPIKLEDERKIRGRKKMFPGVLRPYKCPVCLKTWKTATELKHHMSTHDNSRPYICEICGQAYKHKTALNVHVGMHKGINPFTCLYCNKSFTQKGALQRHIPMHTGERPFQCDLCGKRFVHHTSFNIHRLTHSGQKSYKCDVCNLALLSGSHLKRHMRVHTGEKKYSCPVCDKRFAERYNLVSHQKLHTGYSSSAERTLKRGHRCQVCGQSYEGKIKLDEHIADCHEKVILMNNSSNSYWSSPKYIVKKETVSLC